MRNKPIYLRLIIYLLIFITLITTACKKIEPAVPLIPDPIPGTKPNIILIIGDDVGYEVPGFTGGESYATPNMDAMANQGIIFSRCFGSPASVPSRFMLLTGKYNFRNYNADSWENLGLDQKTIANMLHSIGYSTCATGKWQLNNGDTALKTFGFDTYCITNPYKVASEDNPAGIRPYKNPTLYQDGAYLPEAEMRGKYSEDVMLNYMFDFIDSTAQAKKPFFIYYAPNLCRQPFSPTPDDPQFATWNPNRPPSPGDTVFFESMVRYYDKNIGKLVAKLKAANIENNTLILFLAGDNGTDNSITSKFFGRDVRGGRGQTYLTGIRIAFAACWPGHIAAGKIDNLIDFVDFLPTIADAAGVSAPPSFGQLDGISFYDQLFGNNNTVRAYSYNWYDVNRSGADTIPPVVWALDNVYKLYSNNTSLINYITDVFEQEPIPESAQTNAEKEERATLQSVINAYHN